MRIFERHGSVQSKNEGWCGGIFNLVVEMTGETGFIIRAEIFSKKMQLPVEKLYKPMPFIKHPTYENVEISHLESPILLNYLPNPS